MRVMNLSNVAAYSLQAGMTLKELMAFCTTIGKVPSKEQVEAIVSIRRQLRNTAREIR